MTRDDAVAFTQAWIADWNRRDVEAVLAHYAPDAVFYSPKAATIVGKPKVSGKDELRDYWGRALAEIRSLVFELDHIGFDADGREVFIVYRAKLDGREVRACERLHFGPDGRITDGEGLYGAPV
jgi:ketosteroid isomerase-like protein